MSQLAHAPPGYEYVRPLGSAGYGDAYLATHLTLRRDVVVLNIPRIAFPGPGAIERLRHDAGILAATTDGPMIHILEIDARNDPVSVVTEHVPGTTLADLLDAGPLPASEAIPILEDVAAALRVMARQGLAHGSVGPEHVVVLPHGPARLGGFAVSRALSRTEPDQWSDAYDFAVLAHRTLTGSPPPRSPDDPLPPLPWRSAEVLLAGLSDRARERPLPHALVEVLRGIPVEDWTVAPAPTPVPPHPMPVPTPRKPLRATQPVPATRPEPEDDFLGSWTPPRWLGWICIALGLIVTGGSAAYGAYLLEPWRMNADTVEVRSISVVTDPGPVVNCPRADVVFLATIATNGEPGALSINWIRPDGTQPPTRQVEVFEGQRSVQTQVRYTFTGREAWSGRAVVLVGGDDSGTGKQTIRYVCPGA